MVRCLVHIHLARLCRRLKIRGRTSRQLCILNGGLGAAIQRLRSPDVHLLLVTALVRLDVARAVTVNYCQLLTVTETYCGLLLYWRAIIFNSALLSLLTVTVGYCVLLLPHWTDPHGGRGLASGQITPW